MVDGSEKRNRQLAFELQNSHVCEKRRNSKISLKMLRNKCAKVAFKSKLATIVMIEGSWEVGHSSLVQCKTRFVPIFYIFFFMKHIF